MPIDRPAILYASHARRNAPAWASRVRRDVLCIAALTLLAACATEPSPPLYPVTATQVPRDARGEIVPAAIRPAPGSAPPPLAKPVKPVSCRHFRRCA